MKKSIGNESFYTRLIILFLLPILGINCARSIKAKTNSSESPSLEIPDNGQSEMVNRSENDQIPDCEELDENIISIPNGIIVEICDNNGEFVFSEVNCNEGYEPRGRLCERLEAEPECTGTQLKIKSIDGGYQTYRCNNNKFEYSEVNCNEGYEPRGRLCERLEDEPECTGTQLKQKSIDGGYQTYRCNNNKFEYSEVNCNEGYEPRESLCNPITRNDTPCEFDGQIFSSGDKLIAYKSQSVPYGHSCEVQIRTCNRDGTLSGDFKFRECNTRPASWPSNPVLTLKQTAPLVPSANLDFSELQSILENSHKNSWSKFGVKATNGTNLDVLDIVSTGHSSYKYIGVSHSNQYPIQGTFCVNLTFSRDLKVWHYIKPIECKNSSQASIRKLHDNSYLLAYEYNPGDRGAVIKVNYYNSLADLLHNLPADVTIAPKTKDTLNSGTPSFREIKNANLGNYTEGGLDNLFFELTTHTCSVNECLDKQGFMTWNHPYTDTRPWNINNNWVTSVIPLQTKVKSMGVNGNIGGRDSFDIGGERYFIIEGQLRKNDWSSWRLYLLSERTGKIEKIVMNTPENSLSIGNPKISFITLPDGKAALLGTVFIFSEQPNGNNSEAGTHLFIHTFD